MEGLKQAQDSFSMEMSSELFLKGPYDQQEAPFHQQLGESWVERQPEDCLLCTRQSLSTRSPQSPPTP